MGFLTPWFYDSFWDSPLRSLSSDLRHLRAVESSSSSYSTVQPNYKYRSSCSGITLQVELPGVAREHATVQVEGRTLVIKAKRFRREPGRCTLTEKKREECEVGHTDLVVEVKYYLALKLSERIDRENVKADCCGDGLLVVSVPYKEREVKEIDIGA